MIFHPFTIPVFVELNDAHEPVSRLSEKSVKLLALLVRRVDCAIKVGVLQITRRPALEIVMERLQDLSPAIIVVGVNQDLFSFLARRTSPGPLRSSADR
jgi:hypothetical protein